jgi:hypothetical protein
MAKFFKNQILFTYLSIRQNGGCNRLSFFA